MTKDKSICPECNGKLLIAKHSEIIEVFKMRTNGKPYKRIEATHKIRLPEYEYEAFCPLCGFRILNYIINKRPRNQRRQKA